MIMYLELLWRSIYADHIVRWLESFSPQRLLIWVRGGLPVVVARSCVQRVHYYWTCALCVCIITGLVRYACALLLDLRVTRVHYWACT